MYLEIDFKIKDGRLSICATAVGNSAKRYYKKVPGLINPNLKAWKDGCFSGLTTDAIYNNGILKDVQDRCQSLIDKFDPPTGTELWKLYDAGNATETVNKVLTLGDFLRSVIKDMKTGNNNKKPSGNYHNYMNLLHKLEAEDVIINKPLSEICNMDFIAFGKFILSLPVNKGKLNYAKIMMLFNAIINRAYHSGLIKNALSYQFMKDAPVYDPKIKTALTKAQYQAFKDLDLHRVPQGGKNPYYYLELYHDYCIFLCETLSRPADVLKMRKENIHISDNKIYLKYQPEKTKNHRKRKEAIVEISETAQCIIKKRMDISTQGYIFDFSMNNKEWDYLDANNWNRWSVRSNLVNRQINAFLKKVAPLIGMDKFTSYSFRHTAITHAIKNGRNAIDVARNAGTSLSMIDTYYYDYLA